MTSPRRLLLALVLAAIPPAIGLALLAPTRAGDARTEGREVRPLHGPADPRVVILGNSKAGTDFLVPTLRAELGIPDLPVWVISLGSATMPAYYVVVKNVVLARSRPDVILFYVTGVELLTSDLGPDRRSLLVAPYLTDDEPVVDQKLYSRSPGGFAGVRERAVRARDTTLSAFAAAVAGVAAGSDGRVALDMAFEGVFGQSWAARKRPDRQTIRPGIYPSESVIGTTLEDTFVLETQAMCREAGVPCVFVLAPVHGVIRAREEARLRGLEPLLEQARRRSDGWIVAPTPPDAPNVWRDDEHLNGPAAEANTRFVARELRRLGLAPGAAP